MGDWRLPPELSRLDPDTRDAVLSLAVELVTAPQPIDGLTQQQTRFVRLLQSRPNFWLSGLVIAEAIQSRNLTDPVYPGIANVVYWNIRQRRPDLAERIQRRGRLGYRWVAGPVCAGKGGKDNP